MALPELTPSSTSSKVILPSTGSAREGVTDGSANAANYPIGLYTTGGDLKDTNFMSGAADQVAYVFKKLGGDVLDIELTPANVYSAYEESVLEYSYHINLHQSKNILSNVLGSSTASFDHEGQITAGAASGSNVNLKYPKFKFTYARRVADGVAEEAGFGGNLTEYSASFSASVVQSTYDLQDIIYSASLNNRDNGNGDPVPFSGLVGNNKVRVTRVFYKTPAAMWRFFGYYGGINVIGNMATYGQFADDSTFEIIPAWQNKMQAMAYEDHIYTRISHYSYELINNKLTLFPPPDNRITDKFFVKFTIEQDAWQDDGDGIRKTGVDGINNINSIPFDNLPYKNINAIGKHWIRRYALALCKGMLGQIRGKFGGSIPIPGDRVTLNSSDLLSQASTEKTALIDELKKILDETTYLQLMKNDSELLDATGKILEETPSPIFVG
tara:strand:- start:79 stop:1401 length:1323 start_codon:yes stop_codon:yes gene_type:complete